MIYSDGANFRYSSSGITIEFLFGKHCSTEIFSHDKKMEHITERVSRTFADANTQTRDTQQSITSIDEPDLLESPDPLHDLASKTIAREISPSPNGETDILEHKEIAKHLIHDMPEDLVPSKKRDYSKFSKEAEHEDECGGSQETDHSNMSSLSTSHSITRWRAYYQTLASLEGNDWQPMDLMSTGGGHNIPEKEL